MTVGNLATNAIIDEVWTDSVTLSCNTAAPAGVITMYVGTVAPTGWRLLDGSTVTNASTLFPELWAVVPTGWKSGTSLVLPNMANTFPIGAGTTALGATGGSNTKVIGSANLPTHTHSIDHDHAVFTSATEGSHTHSINHSHGTITSTSESADHAHNFSGTTSTIGDHQHSDNSGLGDWLMTEFGSATSLDLHDGGGSLAYGTTNITAGAGSHSHTYSGTTSGRTVAHSHDVTIPAFTGTSGSGAAHSHSVDIPAFTGTSGNGGFANTPLDVTPAHLAVNFIIKMDT